MRTIVLLASAAFIASPAAAQTGSSSAERLSPPEGQFEMMTPFAPRALLCHAASSAARIRTERGRASSPSGLRTTTWLPGGPATCIQKSRGSPTPKVSASLSASPLPMRTSNPSTSSTRCPRPLLAMLSRMLQCPRPKERDG